MKHSEKGKAVKGSGKTTRQENILHSLMEMIGSIRI